MAEIASHRDGSEFGCGFMGGIFQKWNHWPKKSHVHSLPPPQHSAAKTEKTTNKPQTTSQYHPKATPVKPLGKKIDQGDKNLPPKARSSTSSSSNSSGQNQENIPRRDSVQLDERKPAGQLGKLKVVGNNNNNNSSRAGSVTSNSPGSASRSAVVCGGNIMGNIVRRNSCGDEVRPEALKKMGNEAYKQGKFREALGWYDKAIALDSNKAVYRSNRGAALIGLDRLVEAVSECREAIRIEPTYHRAHHRLATLYLRLGETEKALYHYKLSGSYATPSDIDKARALQNSLVICSEAKKLQKWSVLLNETQRAISSGANSAPLLFALQAEALLKLLRHEEAYKAYQNGPNLSIDVCTNFFGMTSCAYFLMIGSHAYLAVGRFEESVVAAQEAEKLDPSNKEASAAVKRARAVSSARSIGNLLFKEEKFPQACAAYSNGLEHDPHNSVLLSNRAACRSKLCHFEMAIEDCTAALRVHPSYTKARLRRAHCYAKLERWEDSVQDYQVLIKETPEDEEVVRALLEARIQLKSNVDKIP